MEGTSLTYSLFDEYVVTSEITRTETTKTPKRKLKYFETTPALPVIQAASIGWFRRGQCRKCSLHNCLHLKLRKRKICGIH